MGAVGLISKEILFDIEGDAFYIDKKLKETFLILEHTGVHTTKTK